MPQWNKELEILLERAVVAGALAMERLVKDGTSIKTDRKDDASLVTNLDMASQAAMQPVLRCGIQIASEEDPASHALVGRPQNYFLIDPLDGTSSCRRCLMHHKKFVTGNVGFGPLAGFAENGIITAAAFVNLPDRMMFTAVRGQGAWMGEIGSNNLPPTRDKRTRLSVEKKAAPVLSDASLLFYPGVRGEMEFGSYLRRNRLVESLYRFGSFASDCTRIAKGYEQGEIQFSLKAWDLCAALIAEEAGCDVIVDPLGSFTPLASWRLAEVNPALILAPGLVDQARKAIEGYKAELQYRST